MRFPAKVSAGNAPFSLRDLGAALDRNLKRNVTPGKSIDPHQHHFSDLVNLDTLVSDMLLRDKFDVLQEGDSIFSSRYRRIEYPTRNEALLRSMRYPTLVHLSTDAVQLAEQVINEELSKCDEEEPYVWDYAIFAVCKWMTVGKPNITDGLNLLYYRARKQSAVWDVFCQLETGGFLDAVPALCRPFKHDNAIEATTIVHGLLSRFEGPATEKLMLRANQPCELISEDRFELDLGWLATMIV